MTLCLAIRLLRASASPGGPSPRVGLPSALVLGWAAHRGRACSPCLEVGVRGSSPELASSAADRATGSADAREQIPGGGESESAGEDYDRLQAGGALAALEQADLGPVQIADVSQFFLGQIQPLAMGA